MNPLNLGPLLQPSQLDLLCRWVLCERLRQTFDWERSSSHPEKKKSPQLSGSLRRFRTPIAPPHTEPSAIRGRSIKVAAQSASHSGNSPADKRPKSCLRTEIAPPNSTGHPIPNRVYHWPVLHRLSILRGLGNPERWQSCAKIAVADRRGGCDILGQ